LESTTDEKESVVSSGAELVRKLQGLGKLYDKEFERWVTECKRITRRYRSERGTGMDYDEDPTAWFNIFWASLQTAAPALYARTPVPQVERRYKDRDPVARVAAEILERAIRFEIKNFDFDGAVNAAVLDRLLYGRGIARVYYEPKFAVVDGVEVKQGESVRVGYVQLQDFKHSSARTWDEVTQVRFRSYMSKEEAAQRFGKEKAAKLKYTHVPETMEDEKTFSNGEQGDFKKAEVWEVWDKPTRMVIWITDELKDEPLDLLPDPLGLEGFFPIPKPLFGTITNDSLIPVPDARQCKKLYNLLDDIEAKIGALTTDLRVAGLYDAAMEEIPRIVQGGDKLIPVRNYAALKAQGGLVQAIEWWPLDQVVGALQVLYQQKEQTKSDIYEITGWADIMRGTTDPNETAAAQQLKGRFASIRLTNSQNDVQRFCRDLIAIMGEIIAELFEPSQLLAMTGAEFVPGASPEEKQQNYLIAIELLRNEPTRRFRIEIETDSTLAINEALDQQARADFMQSLVGALQTMGPLMEQMPAFVPVLGEALGFVARTYKAGRGLEGAVEQAVESTKEMLAKKSEAPPQPDPKMAEVQGRLQIAQMESQAKMQAAQIEAQVQQAKAQQDAEQHALSIEQARLDAQLKIQQQQVDEYVKQQELAIAQKELEIKANQVQVELLKLQASTEHEQTKQAISQETNRMDQLLQAQKLDLDAMRIKLSEAEKLMEERRLAGEQELERLRIGVESVRPVTAAGKGEPIVINNILPSKPKPQAAESEEDEAPEAE
jgi:hypothetical protein